VLHSPKDKTKHYIALTAPRLRDDHGLRRTFTAELDAIRQEGNYRYFANLSAIAASFPGR
jgi:hypothetical protein